jgi:putative ABC transport system permease protein
MFRNLLLIAYRNIRKHRFHTGLNIFGLSLGLSCALVLFQFVHYHLGFDTYHHNARNLYRVVTDLHLGDGTVEFDKGAPLVLADVLQKEVPQIKNEAIMLQKFSFTVTIPGHNPETKPSGGNGPDVSPAEKFFAEHENTGFADRHWFELFDYNWEAGDAAAALQMPNTAVITRRLAKKYFGDLDPVGQVIRLDVKQQVRITGIISDYPPNTDTKVDLFLSLSSFRNFYPDLDQPMRTNWQWIRSTTSLYVLLPEGFSQNLPDAAMPGIAKRNMGWAAPYYNFHLQPLKEAHFDERYSGVISRSLLTALALVALFLVLIACINFINLATAQQAKRAREIGTRKVLGSGPAGIFWQFMTETGLMVLLAAFGSICLLAVFLPVLNNWLQLDLGFHFVQDGKILLYFLLLLVLIILAAGFYPALILSRVRPIAALKSTSGNWGGPARASSWQRRSLIVLQNGCAQLLIVCALIITMQVNYLKNADLGFDKDAVVIVPIPDTVTGKLTALRDQLLARADIKDLSFCFQAPSSDVNNGGSVRYDDRPWEKFIIRWSTGDSHYLQTFGLRLLAGRNLQESDTVREFLVNEDLVHKLGFKDPLQVIGHRLVAGDMAGDHPGIIAGVIRDFHYHSLYSGIDPVVIATVKEKYKYAAIKLSGSSYGGSEGLKEIGRIWKSVYPENVFEYHFLNEQIENFYHNEDLLNKLVGAAALIAITISCLGLLGLVSLMTLQRTKEIGIRKVAGASEGSILVLLSKDFMQLLILAVLIAFPFALLVMHQWLQHFAYRIPVPGWIFLVSGLGGVCLALLTVGYHAMKAARANPVIALRSE